MYHVQDASRFWPGLGGSDTDYAWALVFSPIFELAAMPFTALVLHRFPYTISMLITPLMIGTGGAIYAVAVNKWMVFIAKGLIGIGASGAATVHAYLGEMGTVMDDIRQKQGKKPRKFILYIVLSFVLNSGIFLAYVSASVMAQFPDVNPYRWPGWLLTAMASTQVALVLICFRETSTVTWVDISSFKCSCLSGLKLSAQLMSKWKVQVRNYLFLVVCGVLVGHTFACLNTIVPLVLSDKFGFSVEFIPHFYSGIALAYITSSFIQLGSN
jgi:hypothetical protein